MKVDAPSTWADSVYDSGSRLCTVYFPHLVLISSKMGSQEEPQKYISAAKLEYVSEL